MVFDSTKNYAFCNYRLPLSNNKYQMLSNYSDHFDVILNTTFNVEWPSLLYPAQP